MGLSRTLIGEHAAVASEQPLASMVGYDILRRGGNAFDAAAATSFALAVTFHPAGGLGGDFFGMLYEAKTGKVHCLNGSGWSPSGLTLDLVKLKAGGKVPLYGPLTCVVPGLAAGVWEMQRRFGDLEFKELLEPAVKLAVEGFPIGAAMCRSIAGALSDFTDDAKNVFASGGKLPVPGECIKQEALGKVIAEVAEGGAPAFYSGWPAEKISSTLESLGVPCSKSDFSQFKPEWVAPLTLDYRGTLVYEVPPNSMGATSLLILKQLAEVGLSAAGPLSRDRIEKTMKAVLLAYARRDEMLGDPRFGKIDMGAFMSTKGGESSPSRPVREGDTTAFSVADAKGNMVSGIQSLFHHFGSRVFVKECGIALSNRASAFYTEGPNKVEPHKRPLHTLSSLLLERNGRPYLAIGASGGDYRPLQHALFVTNSVDYSMPAEENVAHPRFLWGGGRNLLVENGYELPLGRDYDIETLPLPGRTGVCQAVEVSESYRKAVCDVRGDGIPSGF
ncbi:MAG: gamma-glutamyltransferase family protein [Nitrososphaerota archaeon]|nr:gamma-glutamyltransferase family protein [Nitrososphaerota archaeon]MDG6941621.1 gamma-glutamyltransferase family protein [Nitrososphaerota archaeon]MDG6951217.1 gamma-glutamyltransferase family protein [Nitrososphaerota archaeon]